MTVVFFLIVIGIALYGTAVWLLWNAIMPALFGLPQIEFGQAVALYFLCQFLFGKSIQVKSK